MMRSEKNWVLLQGSKLCVDHVEASICFTTSKVDCYYRGKVV